MERIRVVYFGTPAYAAPPLRRVVADARFEVALVVTQPDRPAGRGRAPAPSAVKLEALRLGLPVYQPETLRTPESREPLIAAKADVFLVAAFGIIFGPRTLAIPSRGCLNLHASLLPRYRGASPVTAAILMGDRETGVTLMRMSRGLDTGDIIGIRRATIDPSDTTESLTARLAQDAAILATLAIPEWVDGRLAAKPQPTHGATLTRPLQKADGWINWDHPARQIERHIRAMWPWPRAFTTLPDGRRLQIESAVVIESTVAAPGTVQFVGRQLLVGCGHGAIRLVRVRPESGASIEADALIHGRKIEPGHQLGRTGAPASPLPLVVEVGSG